jgi:hypothetical protein
MAQPELPAVDEAQASVDDMGAMSNVLVLNGKPCTARLAADGLHVDGLPPQLWSDVWAVSALEAPAGAEARGFGITLHTVHRRGPVWRPRPLVLHTTSKDDSYRFAIYKLSKKERKREKEKKRKKNKK